MREEPLIWMMRLTSVSAIIREHRGLRRSYGETPSKLAEEYLTALGKLLEDQTR